MPEFEGGCHCGRLRYRLVREPIFVNCCHCRQCQRLTGSAFALNAMVEAEAIKRLGDAWSPADTRGDRPGHREWRCSDCGVLLFAEHPHFGAALAFVRVGTLDEAERLVPDAHYFVRSKHPWVVIPHGLPAYETVPASEDETKLSPERETRIAAALAAHA